jgi:hypothetical protein
MSAIGNLFKKPKTPGVQNAAVPSRSDAEMSAAAEEQRRRTAQMSSATSWLTGGGGVDANKMNYAGSRLLSGT